MADFKTPSETGGDDELIAAILGGAEDRFQELMARHQQAVFGYLYRLLLRDVELARDLTQTVFFKAYRNLASVERGRPLTPWLMRIAHNEAANHLRARARHPEQGLDDEAWDRLPATDSPNPEQATEASLDAERVAAAMAALPRRMREAVTLHYHEDRSYNEIAEIMNLSVGAVGTLIHRARNRLAQLLEGTA